MLHHAWKISLCLLCLGTLVLPSLVSARGFRNPNQSASAGGQGLAFTAQADDPSAIYYNPAGMTQLRGVQVAYGLSLISSSTSFRGPTGVTTTGNYGEAVAFPPPAHFYATANLKDLGVTRAPITAGFGITAPFGLLYRYPENSPFATAGTFAALPLLDLKPTLAYKVTESFSVGVGADVYTFASFIGAGQFKEQFQWPGGGGIPAGSRAEINGSDTAAGFNVSLLYTPYRNEDGKPLVNIGFQYRSQATLHLQGQFLVNGAVVADAATTLVLPPIYTGAIAVWPVRDRKHEWKLEADVDYTGWKSIRNLNTTLSTGSTLPFPLNWQSQYMVMLGSEFRWLDLAALPEWHLALRGGYLHTKSPVPDATFNPIVPDADQHILTTGAGFACRGRAKFLGVIPCSGSGIGSFRSQGLTLDLAYLVLLYEPRTVAGNMNPTVNGTYHTTTHLGTLTLTMQF